MPKNSVGESFTVALNSGSEKVCIGWGGEYRAFPSKILCVTVRKTFVGESFTVALVSSNEKVWRRGGGISRFSV